MSDDCLTSCVLLYRQCMTILGSMFLVNGCCRVFCMLTCIFNCTILSPVYRFACSGE